MNTLIMTNPNLPGVTISIQDSPHINVDVALFALQLSRQGFDITAKRVDDAPSRPAPKRSTHVKPRYPWSTGDHVYLKWSKLDADQKLSLSNYRTIKGEVVSMDTSNRVRSVRFNSDPPVTLTVYQLSHTAEYE